MGEWNSSETRVRPIFNELIDRSPSGGSDKRRLGT
jgi:hypothetical protein